MGSVIFGEGEDFRFLSKGWWTIYGEGFWPLDGVAYLSDGSEGLALIFALSESGLVGSGQVVHETGRLLSSLWLTMQIEENPPVCTCELLRSPWSQE